jgi:hypothetical protein
MAFAWVIALVDKIWRLIPSSRLKKAAGESQLPSSEPAV